MSIVVWIRVEIEDVIEFMKRKILLFMSNRFCKIFNENG